MNRGEIWSVSLDPTIGAEMRKTRPGLIVNDDSLGLLPLKVIVPITSWDDRYESASWMVKIEPNSENGLKTASSADCFQIRSMAEERLRKYIGTVSAPTIKEIEKSLSLVLDLSNEED